MAPVTTLSIVLEITPDASPIQGWIVAPDGCRLVFAGWMELTSHLSTLVSASPGNPGVDP